ncbi:MAG: alpha/beta hydrolase, partial [Coleofasciculaceae cyanobacterium]
MNSSGLSQRDLKLKNYHLKYGNFGLTSQALKLRVRLPTRLGIALLNLGLLCAPVVIPTAAQGAQEIYISYGPLEVSLPIASLELYATTGKIDSELSFYAGYLTPEQLVQLKKVLVTRVDVTPVAIAQFLYSTQGEIILNRIGEIIQTKARQPGFYAIRASLIKAAARPEGLTLLNILREFPTHGIRIDSNRGFQVIESLSNLVRQTGVAIAAVEQQASQEIAFQTPPQASTLLLSPIISRFSRLTDLRQTGQVSHVKQSFTLNDLRRGRTFPVDLYLPNINGLAPLIVISHGLGSDRSTFVYLAKHLASYGFAVAVPEHPGSNAQQIQELINGLANQITAPTELADRPLDIKFMLDELKREFSNRLNFQEVGVLGQSLGGYTSLALVGAKINYQQLEKDCLPNDSLNLSLLVQCRALEQPFSSELQDSRIKAAVAINPIGSSIFGQDQFAQIKTPLMLVSGSDDTVAPALPEQIQPFTWLTTPNKYLALIKGGTHFSTLVDTTGAIPVPASAIGPSPEVARDYMKALSVAFFKTYIANDSSYQAYLNASYGQFISQNTLPLNLIQSLTEAQLQQAQANPQP